MRYPVELVGQMTDNVRAALAAANIIHTGSHGGGTTVPSTELPEPDHHTVWVEAEDRKAAGDVAEKAIAGIKGIYFRGPIDADPAEFGF
ncbi:hypothetical protein LCGC14_2420060 [marine sediment metagenome]|uniref:YCII-related domain-containing protein n=1 Tax=marine sediment metagenome TaxID=412755 RepID=A0A0F9BQ11_9ZZZZ